MAGTKNDTLIGKNADFSQAGGPNANSSDANGLNTNGQMWIGSTASNVGGTHINVGTLTSPDGSITVGYSSPNITLTTTQTPQIVIKGPIVDLLTLGNTSIFTFTDKFVITGIVFNAVLVAGVPNSDYVVNFGWTAPNYNDIITAFTQGGPGATNFESGVFLPSTINNFEAVPAGQTLTVRVTTTDTGAATYLVRIDIMGYYF